MPSHAVRPKSRSRSKSPKRSSPAARRLIESAVSRYGSEVKAARALGLPNQAQLNKMRRGLIKDTPAMRAALLKAKARAKRAWAMVPEVHEATLDVETIQAQITMLGNDVEVLNHLIKTQS